MGENFSSEVVRRRLSNNNASNVTASGTSNVIVLIKIIMLEKHGTKYIRSCKGVEFI